MRKKRKKRRKTKREQQMMMNKNRVRHEARKKGKDRNNSTMSHVMGDWAPHIQAMFAMLVTRRRR